MEIPLNAQVECTDGEFGKSIYVLINPVIDTVTDVVVKANIPPHTEYIVPIEFVIGTIADRIQLRCSQSELQNMEPFYKTTFIEEKMPEKAHSYGIGAYGMGTFYYLPYTVPERNTLVQVSSRQVPLGKLSVRRGARVKAKDGYVGNVDEFVVNKENSYITHLVMRENHLFGKKDVIIPLSAIKNMDTSFGDTVFLNIDKQEIDTLPTFPLHRRWS